MGNPTPISMIPDKIVFMNTTLEEFLSATPSDRRDYMKRSLLWDCSCDILAAAVEDKDRQVRMLVARNPKLPYSLWFKCFKSRSKAVRRAAMNHPKATEWSDPLYELRQAANSSV